MKDTADGHTIAFAGQEIFQKMEPGETLLNSSQPPLMVSAAVPWFSASSRISRYIAYSRSVTNPDWAGGHNFPRSCSATTVLAGS